MTTSLSRQLERLKTPLTACNQEQVLHGTAPSLVEDVAGLDPKRLRLLALEAFDQLSTDCPALYPFRARLFPEDTDEPMEVDESEEDNEAQDLCDVYLMLSHAALRAPVQYLLQYLLTVHQLHAKDPEMFLWSLMPHFEFKIFNLAVTAVVQTLPKGQYPPWLNGFLQACHPATRVGLRKHAARDKGFFKVLCHLLNRTLRHRARYPDVDYDRHAHFFVSVVTSALDSGVTIDEHHVMGLMQVIVPCLKSNHGEFRATGATLMAHVLPKVTLKAKVVQRLLKVIRKCCSTNVDFVNLALWMILVKSQIEAVPMESALTCLGLLEVTIRDTWEGKSGRNNPEYHKKMLGVLALLLKRIDMADEEFSNGQDALVLLDLIHHGLGLIRPDLSFGIILIQTLRGAINHIKMEKDTSRSEQVRKCKDMMASLKTMFPEQYLQFSGQEMQEGDIMFLEGTVGDFPSSDEIAAKKILMDNPLIAEVRGVYLELQRAQQSPLVKENLKTHAASVKTLFSSVSPRFLILQITAEEMTKITCNLIRLYCLKPKVVSKIIPFICSEEFNTNTAIQKELKAHGIEVDLLLLQFLILPSDDYKVVLEASKKTWFFKNTEGLTQSILFSRQCNLKKPYQDFNKEVIEKLEKSLDASKFISLLDKVGNSLVLQSPGLITLLLLVASYQLSHARKTTRDHTADEVLQLLRICRDKLDCEVKQPPQEASNEIIGQAMEAQIVIDSAKTRTIPVKAIDYALESLRNVSFSELIAYKMFYAICAWKKLKHKVIVQDISDILFSSLDKDGRLDVFLSGLLTKPTDKNWNEDSKTNSRISPAMQDFALRELKTRCLKNPEMKKQVLGSKSNILPQLLAILAGESAKRRGHAMGILDCCYDAAASDGKSFKGFALLVHFFRDNRAAFLGDPENIQTLMAKFSKQNKNSLKVLRCLLELVLDFQVMGGTAVFLTPLFAKEDMIKICEHGYSLLESKTMKVDGDEDVADEEKKKTQALVKIVDYFLPTILYFTLEPQCWNFLDRVFQSSLPVDLNGNQVSLGSLALHAAGNAEITNPEVILPIYDLLIAFSTDVQQSDILIEAKALIGTFPLNGEHILNKLKNIWGQHFEADIALSRTSGRGRFSEIYGKDFPVSESKLVEQKWSRTFFVLETGGKAFGKEGEKLLKPLFALLGKALGQNESTETSYALDLILSQIHEILDSKSDSELSKLEATMVNPELLVQCIRICANPGTKSVALLILAKASTFNPEYVLQNSIQIFTFMGTHFLKIDSKQSFDVACQAIDIIIPHIQRVCQSKGPDKLHETSLSIITTFVDASVDMATHRFKIFLHKLIKCLGESDFLWVVTLLLLKTVGKKRTIIEGQKTKTMKFNQSEKLQQIQSLYSEFSAMVQIESVLRMMINLKNDNKEVRKMLKIGDPKDGQTATEEGLNSANEYDLIRLKMLNFVSSQLSSKYFIRQVIQALESGDQIHQNLHLLIQCSILSLETYEKTTKESRIHKHLIQLSERILEGALGVLPAKVFVALFNNLLANEFDTVRRKTLEVLNAKLQEGDELLLKEESLPNLLMAMTTLATGKVIVKGQELVESEMNQQLAILGVRSFAKAGGFDHGESLQKVASILSKASFFKTLPSANVKASTLLCLSEIFMSIGPLAVAHLMPFVVWILELMADVETIQMNPILFNSIILAIQKLMENFSGFLNPHFKSFIVATCSLSQIEVNPSDQTRHLSSRIRNLQSSLSQGIPSHSLLSICRDCFDDLKGQSECVSTLLSILRENVSTLTKEKAMAISAPFMDFFLHAFKYRETMKKKLPMEKINEVETNIIEAFLALTLKLSLDDFKPLFYRVFNLSLDAAESNIYGTITVFHITVEVAKKLKSLFEFISETLILKATNVLNHYFKAEKVIKNERLVLQLLLYIMESLQTIFTFNKIESILTKNYEDHVNSLLAFLGYEFFIPDHLDLFLNGLTSCLSQLALSTEDETQWKYLNYNVLLNLRSSSSVIRSAVLNIITQFVEKKGDEYMGVLPDAVTFLFETLEDEDPEIEKSSKRLIKRMEEVFGQSVESYFV
ncbi:hypothetical protein TCAL_03802 [Tigriopus californicus]|uniref:HEAT repeat-containing protein 1 n=1 Tax=Tigriopus californicus TaxID=6832 RepID=A0A553NSB7_TIGCA|nr:HEAT repeat-containing protein 1-like [Tigriopus californicus]TRY68333.1 hypothetical protein TCAL_03802 [Tigriopus californicus]|eukprot:TCALIF_03802-PA protein Name:"Similar to heatr1 HEAT repeat-containing protein 1 (Danio rerio)" AED:0.00 eAED:0.00 QI:126/1/1/1/1/1/2/47/2057